MNTSKRKAHETLAKFFGEKWIENRLNKVKLDGYHSTSPINLANIDFHPLIKAIVATQIKLAYSEANGKAPVAIGRSEALQTLLHHNLTILEPNLDLEYIKERLQNKEEFPKVEYELAIAAGYKRMGSQIEFIPRSSEKRTGEFYTTDANGNKVLIECKKKDIVSPKEEQIGHWWVEFQHLMIQRLKSAQKYYGILIHIPADPVRAETHLAIEEIVSLILMDKEGENSILNEKYKVTLKKFCEAGESIISSEFDLFGEDSIFAAGSAKRDRHGRLHQPIKTCGYASDFIEVKVKSVILTLANAYGQLDADKPNVLYIDVNIASMMPEKSAQLMSILPGAVQEKLNKDYSKISAVVLTNLKLLGHSGAYGFHADEYAIYNPRAINRLPITFRIYGDIQKGQSILEDMGRILNS